MRCSALEKSCKKTTNTPSSYVLSTRAADEFEEYELRHHEFYSKIREDDDGEALLAVEVIRSISSKHREVGKRDFTDTEHYKRYQHTNDIKCIRKRDDQVISYPSGDLYDGQFVSLSTHSTSEALLKHGKGKYSYSSGDVYEGDWQYDKWYYCSLM